MANEKVAQKAPTLQQRIAARQAKRAEIGKEAQVRVAAAYTIAKTMLPTAPADIRKVFASSLLNGNSTKALKVALRTTAINAHNTKLAETLKEVHKVELNQLLEASGDLEKAKGEVKSELKGDAKAATSKKADDRKDAGPQPASYDEGARKEPTDMDASGSEKREALTVDKTEGGERIEDAVQDSARAKAGSVKKADIMSQPAAPSAVADSKAEIRASVVKKAHGKDCPCAECKEKNKKAARYAANKKAGHGEGCECATCNKEMKESASEKEANFGVDGKPNAGELLQTKAQTASKAKKADEPMPMGDGAAEPGNAEEAMPAPDGAAPMGEPGPEGAEALIQDEQGSVLEEKVQEAEQAVQAIEQELNKEKGEEIDLTGLGGEGPLPGEIEGEPGMGGQEMEFDDMFSTANLQEKASNLANEHHEGADEDYFGPSASSDLEASLDEPQMASLEDMFAHEASADPMAGLFERTASNVEGFEVVPSSTGEAANKFKAEHGREDRDNETDHDNDILSLLVEGLNEQEDGQERVKQDATPELETSAASKEASKKPASLKHIKASAGAPKAAAEEVNIADALFASIDSYEDERNARGPKQRR